MLKLLNRGLYFLNMFAILCSISSYPTRDLHDHPTPFKQKDLMNDVFDEAMHFLFRVHLLLSQQLLSPIDRFFGLLGEGWAIRNVAADVGHVPLFGQV